MKEKRLPLEGGILTLGTFYSGMSAIVRKLALLCLSLYAKWCICGTRGAPGVAMLSFLCSREWGINHQESHLAGGKP